MEFVNIKGNTWAACGPVNIGAYVINGEAVLIDSGNDSSSGRKVLRLAEEKNWKIKLIINTHFHADHVGGNAFIQKRTNCGIAASAKEAPFIDMPEMEPEILWSGRAPKAICNKFLQAEKSSVTLVLRPDTVIEGWGLRIVPLPGHAHGQIGVFTPDGVLFTADSVISERILSKYGIPFTADHCSAMETFDMLESFEADFFVPSHGDICEDIIPVTDANRRCLNALREEILEICSEPSTRDGIVGKLAQRHGLDMNLPQYVLIQSTVAALLSPLIDSGEILCSFNEGTLSLKSRP